MAKLQPKRLFVDADSHIIDVRHNFEATRVWITGTGLGVIDMTPNQALVLSHTLKEFALTLLGIEESKPNEEGL